jgi:hypothetical protein
VYVKLAADQLPDALSLETHTHGSSQPVKEVILRKLECNALCTCSSYMWAFTKLQLRPHTYTNTLTHTDTYTHRHTSMSTHTHTSACTHKYTYTHTYVYTSYTSTHMHTHKRHYVHAHTWWFAVLSFCLGRCWRRGWMARGMWKWTWTASWRLAENWKMKRTLPNLLFSNKCVLTICVCVCMCMCLSVWVCAPVHACMYVCADVHERIAYVWVYTRNRGCILEIGVVLWLGLMGGHF